jgi:signal transduction histidine kinase
MVTSVETGQTPPLPELGQALLAAKAPIIRRWREKVMQAYPAFDSLTRQQLDDSLPQLLDDIAKALAVPTHQHVKKTLETSPVHGQTRFHQKFDLAQLLSEYALLRPIAHQEVMAAIGRALSTTEAETLNEWLDVAMRQGAVAFADFQAAAMKSETAAMTKFLSFLSHDLRGGLNGAVLMIEVLRRQLANEPKFGEAMEDLEVVRRSILDTVATMERFLHAERLRLGRMPVKIGEVRVGDLVEELQKKFSYHLKDAGMTLSIDADADRVITSDRQLLTIILTNLLSNAIKFGRRGTVTLKGEASPADVPGCAYRFTITDQGPGIATERLKELFASYQQGETYGQKGAGLGLFIARHAADLLGATVTAEAPPGKGAQFFLALTKA